MGNVAVALFILVMVVFTLKWVGAWMLGITNVMDKQDKTIKGLQQTNEILKKMLVEMRNHNGND